MTLFRANLRPMSKPGPVWAVALASLAFVWVAAIWTAPGVAAQARPAALVYVVGAVVCHQRPDRSFHLAGAQLPVCARCTSLYTAGAIGMLAWLGTRRRRHTQIDPSRARRWLVAAAVPALASVALGMTGIWDGSNLTRALLSAPLGLAAGALVCAVAARDLR